MGYPSFQKAIERDSRYQKTIIISNKIKPLLKDKAVIKSKWRQKEINGIS